MSERAADARSEAAPPGLGTRALSLIALVGIVGSLGWLVVQIAGVFLNAWVAPINLSPDSDHVIHLNLQIARQLADVERVEAEVQRIEHDLEAIDEGIARLDRLRSNTDDIFQWAADVQGQQADTLRQSIRALERQRQLLVREREQDRRRLEEARRNLEVGLVGRNDVAAREHALAQTELSLAANERALLEARLSHQQADVQSSTLEATLAGGPAGSTIVRGRMPEVVARQEQVTRVEVEIIQLRAQRRGLVAMRDMAQRNLARMQEALEQIRTRPLYRATQANMDVAFVPYEQIDGVYVGAEVTECTFWIFACRPVGRIAEIVPGEVVTQDPWGETARGRYAVLDLDDPRAVEERILRVR